MPADAAQATVPATASRRTGRVSHGISGAVPLRLGTDDPVGRESCPLTKDEADDRFELALIARHTFP